MTNKVLKFKPKNKSKYLVLKLKNSNNLYMLYFLVSVIGFILSLSMLGFIYYLVLR
jgi:hypothetical protein